MVTARTRWTGLLFASLLTGIGVSAQAAITWQGTAGDDNWSTQANWNPASPPAGQDILFDNTDAQPTAGTVNNVVDSSVAANSLRYDNYHSGGDNYHTTEIDSGQVLTVNGTVTIGPDLPSNTVTRVDITGDGSLVVNAPGGRFQVGGSTQNGTGNSATLDMSGLSSFQATVGIFRVGDNTTGCCPTASSTAILADTNTITATRIELYSLQAGTQTLRLGSGSNALNADNIHVGMGNGRSGGLLQFNDTTGSLTVRAANGADRANLYVISGNSGTGFSLNGTFDVTDHQADLLLDYLGVGNRSSGGGSSNNNGTFSFNQGTLDVNTIVLGHKTGGSSTGPLTGTVNLGGGTVNVGSGGIALGSNTTGAGSASATLNVSGGTVNVNGNVTMAASGTNTSGTLNLSGGTLDITGSVTDGAGTSTLNVNDGTMTIGAGLSVDNLRVGRANQAGANANLTVGGGAVTIGDSGAGSLDVGVRLDHYTANGAASVSVLDLGSASGVTIDVAAIRMGAMIGSLNNEGTTRGDLILSQAGNNSITADSILAGDSNPRGNSVMSTIQLGGADNAIHTDQLTLGGRKSQATMTIAAGGALTLGGKTGAAVDVDLGISVNGTGTTSIGTLDTTGGTIDATIGTLRMGQQNGGNGSATGTLTFDAGTVAANNVVMATGSKSGANINVHGGTMTVAGSVTDGSGTSNINVDDGTMTVANGLEVDNLRVGFDGTGQLTAGGSVRLGSGTSHDVFIGRKSSSSGPVSVGNADFSSATTVDVNVDELRVGYKTGGGSTKARGTLSLGNTNNLTANTLVVGESDSSYHTDPADVSTLHLGDTNVVRANTIIIGNRRSSAEVDIAAGGTLDVASRSGGRADLHIARNDVGTNSRATGVVDLSGATSFTALLDTLAIGDKGNTSDGRAVGIFTLAQSNNIDANEIVVGRSGNTGADSAADQSQLHLGGGLNTILAPSLIVGDRKTTGLIDFAAPGGTLNLGTSTNRAEITLGRKSVGTANNAAGTMDLRDGTANIYASDINLGQETNTGSSGTPSGTIWLGDGSLDVSGNISENHAGGGAGNSTLNVVGTQTFNVAGTIAVDDFRIGYNADNGSVTAAAGSTVTIGTGAGNLDVGLRTAALTGTPATVGLLDFSGAQGVQIDVANLRLGNILGSPSGEGSAQGTLILSQQTGAANSIKAASIIVGDSPGRGNSVLSSIQLGPAANSINTDTLVIGGQKSRGRITIAAGGTLTLEGRTPGTPVDIDLGFNVTGNTGTHSVGELDMTGGTLNATIGQMRLGRHVTGSGSGTGTFTLEAGSVTAATILLGTGSGNSTGTVNLAGGTLSAGTIDDGPGTANFHFTGGTLHVDNFGFDLVQNGGVLAPGNSPGITAIDGNYTINSGTLEIEIEGSAPGTGYDQVLVGTPTSPDYDVDLGSGLLDLVFGGSGWSTGADKLWIINNQTGGSLIDTFDNYAAGGPVASYEGKTWYLYYEADFDTGAFAGGNDVLLTSVPEPSTFAALVGLAAMALLVCAKRRRR